MKFAVALIPFVAYLASSAAAAEVETARPDCPKDYYPVQGQCLPYECRTKNITNNPRCRIYPEAKPSCAPGSFALHDLCFPNKCMLRIYTNDPACRHSDVRAQCPSDQFSLDDQCFPDFCKLRIYTNDPRCFKHDLVARDGWDHGHDGDHDRDDQHWHNGRCDDSYVPHRRHGRTCVWTGCYSESERRRDNGEHCCPTDVFN